MEGIIRVKPSKKRVTGTGFRPMQLTVLFARKA